MKYSVVIVAAGVGSRMNLGYNKVYHKINGQTILEKTMEIFENDQNCRQIVVVTDRKLYHQHIKKYCGKYVIVEGGKTRQESVYKGLFPVIEEVVYVHDGARAYVSKDSLDRLGEKMKDADAAFLAVPCKDTIKMVQNELVEKTLPRERLYQAQTPQAFKTELLRKCYQKAFESSVEVTDDASVVELFSDTKVYVVEGDYSNIKITTPEDLKK